MLSGRVCYRRRVAVWHGGGGGAVDAPDAGGLQQRRELLRGLETRCAAGPTQCSSSERDKQISLEIVIKQCCILHDA